MQKAETKDVDVKSFLPDKKARAQWEATTKAQLSQAYLDYIITNNRETTPDKQPNLLRTPPAVEPLPVEKAHVMMLPLMDISSGSAEGVGQVLDHVATITGRPLKDHPGDLQVVEGDVGTCINLESCRSKLQPAGRKYESMINYLTIPGAAHTMWNVGHWYILGGWGHAEDDKDMPFSKSWESLAGKTERPASKKDFGLIMRMINHTHFATMVWCLNEVIKTRSPTPDLLDNATAKSILEETHAKAQEPKFKGLLPGTHSMLN
ncbi:uncharacterized protein MELLADRAFT_106959 [Melampsora larici-populina 98AG31]|uniref:DUF6589 domain-containing protein n=1 Tax=Melampsora larici-populina (strain 98AG31 / pathotype 3-4-7) TaxID=747676 RepID=F4RN72_MELLP|nr:uncharacterized protein MELLADRAFT_106959 [Melampsora larici-populina 98AG31]EGG06270.1 hypothetical protein MELLADRAFT_106959 [Melampsora larici-populina 98AG31]